MGGAGLHSKCGMGRQQRVSIHLLSMSMPLAGRPLRSGLAPGTCFFCGWWYWDSRSFYRG